LHEIKTFQLQLESLVSLQYWLGYTKLWNYVLSSITKNFRYLWKPL